MVCSRLFPVVVSKALSLRRSVCPRRMSPDGRPLTSYLALCNPCRSRRNMCCRLQFLFGRACAAPHPKLVGSRAAMKCPITSALDCGSCQAKPSASCGIGLFATGAMKLDVCSTFLSFAVAQCQAKLQQEIRRSGCCPSSAQVRHRRPGKFTSRTATVPCTYSQPHVRCSSAWDAYSGR